LVVRRLSGPGRPRQRPVRSKRGTTPRAPIRAVPASAPAAATAATATVAGGWP